MFADLCLQLRSSTASWYRAYLVCQTQESCFQFRNERADACGSWTACVPSGTWNRVQLAQINLWHCSSGETVRDEHAKPVANCCLSVKIFFSIL